MALACPKSFGIFFMTDAGTGTCAAPIFLAAVFGERFR